MALTHTLQHTLWFLESALTKITCYFQRKFSGPELCGARVAHTSGIRMVVMFSYLRQDIEKYSDGTLSCHSKFSENPSTDSEVISGDRHTNMTP